MSDRRVSRPAALRRLPIDRHAVIDASAGTGKTFTLEHLVVELVLAAGATLEDLLIVTYTERATNELRVRIRAKLEELLAGGGVEASEAEIRAGDAWTLDTTARTRLSGALASFDGTSVSTIHAFCQRVLRENAFASGRLFEEQQVDAKESFGRAVVDVLRREVAADPVRGPWLAAALRGGMSVSAIRDVLWSCVQARGELRPVFDPAALDAAIAAFPVDDALRSDGKEALRKRGVHARTAGSISNELYEMALAVERARAAGDAPGLAFVVDPRDLKLSYLLEKLPAIVPAPGPIGHACAAALALARATPSLQAAVAGATLGPVRDELARRKRRAGQYDFDDMLGLLAQALAGAGSDALVESLRRRYRFALVDEFQDTDETQWQIFRRAFFAPGPGPASRVFLVGDPKQSIYRFRGADVQTFEAARDDVLAAGGSSLRLDTSFRATAALVEAHNAIFDPSAAEPFFTGAGVYAPVACGRPDRQLVDGDGRAVSPVHVFRFEREVPGASLGALVAREIRKLSDPARPWKLDGKPLRHDDVFVLTRTKNESRAMGDALRVAGVPHAFYKEEGLFQTDEARDLRTLLAAIDEPGDRARRLSAWMTPFFGLPLEHIDRARDVPAGHPLVGRLHAWRVLAETRDFERLFESIVRESGVVRRDVFLADGERALTNTLHVFEVLLEHARRERVTLRDLVMTLTGLVDQTRLPLEMEGGVQRLESERRSVQIMTIHKAKGLEAAVVFVAGGLSSGKSDTVHIGHDAGRRLAWVGKPPPGVKESIDEEEQQEDERLMYVALTRARGRLYLPCAVKDGAAAPMRGGAYESVNRRLVALAGSPLLSIEDAPRAALRSVPPASDARARAWSPPPGLLAPHDRTPHYAALREARAGALLTSYTRMKGAASGARAAWAEEAVDRRADKGAREIVADAGPAPLRSARASGVFVHEVLELVPLASFAGAGFGAGAFDGWRADPGVAAVFSRAMAVHRIDPAQREHAERMVWAAYTTELALPAGGTLGGLASAASVVREMDFVFPVPEAGAYVRGSIDLAFEHRGLTYFVDWKSDSLGAFDAASLGEHVATHYEEQVELYALATVKLLGVGSPAQHEGRFGGLLYVFLRGLDGAGRGLWSARPSWADVEAWERSLRARARRS